MLKGKLSGLMIGALVLVAVGGRGYAAEMTVKASAPTTGEGRFDKTRDLQRSGPVGGAEVWYAVRQTDDLP